MKNKLILFFFIVGFSSELHAQFKDSSTKGFTRNSLSSTESPSTSWWLTCGYGVSTVSDAEIGLGVAAIMSVEYGHHVFSARIIHDQGAREDVYPKQLIFDTGLLYGIGTHDSLWFGNASVGFAYTATTKSMFDHTDSSGAIPQDKNRAELFRGIGLAWQLQIFSKFSDSSKAGMGVSICGNVNRSFPFWMLLYSFEFGIF